MKMYDYQIDGVERAFLGEVDYLSTNQLKDILGFELPNNFLNLKDFKWLKFIDEGVIKYFPKSFIATYISYNDLLNECLVDNRYFQYEDKLYLCRLINGSKAPVDFDVKPFDTRFTEGSEWNNLMYNISHQKHFLHGMEGKNYPLYGTLELGSYCGIGRCIISTFDGIDNEDYCIFRAHPMINSCLVAPKDFRSDRLSWRPLIELVSD